MKKSYEEVLEIALSGPEPSDDYGYYRDIEEMVEKMETGITEEDAKTPIPDSIPGVKSTEYLKNRSGVTTLDDLVNTTYERYLMFRSIGEKSREALYEYVHASGYTTAMDRVAMIKHCVELKRKDAKIEFLDKLGLSKKVLFLLYLNGLYTMEDLAKIGAGIFNIRGLNDEDRKHINEKVGNIVSVLEANRLLTIRIKDKEANLDEYSRQVAQYNALLAKEACLDKMINSIGSNSSEIKRK